MARRAEASERLSMAALESLPSSIGAARLQIDPAELSIGLVHFGIGAFHRAHQAVFTEDAIAATGDTRWGILGVTGRSNSVVRQLRPQDCLYGVLERGADVDTLRLVASVRDVAWPGVDSDRIADAIAASTTHIATLTITEKGYQRAQNGDIDLGSEAVRADAAVIAAELAGESGLPPSRTPLGLLVRGLARRFRREGEPFTVVSCDNVVDNGQMTRRLVLSLAAASVPELVEGTSVSSPELVACPERRPEEAARGRLEGEDAKRPSRREGPDPALSPTDFVAWLEASVTFPSTMVDRLTPATTGEDRERALALLGLSDEALVVAEPFSQWVIEDDFAGPRPAWERAGAILTADVAPYERAKLRILNGAHSMLAYFGALAGHETIAQAVMDEPLRTAVLRALDDDILPTVTAPAGIDLVEYRDSVLHRFANPQLKHKTRQVAMDGSHKIPLRFLGAAAERLAAGHVPHGLALAVAAWIAYIAAASDAAGAELDDPLAGTLKAAVGTSESLRADPVGTVERVFAIDEVFGRELRASARFRAAVVGQLPVVRTLTGR